MSSNSHDKTLLAVQASMHARMPVMLVGAPGTGKTAMMRALASQMGYELLTLIASQMDPTDIVGLPKSAPVGKDSDGEVVYGTVNLPTWWQVRIMTRKKIILFLDEFSNTTGATRASLLTLLQNREFPNGDKMPAEAIIVGAMNPTSQAADGYELDMPTTNRLFFINWSPTTDSWIEGMSKAWGKSVSEDEMKWRRKIVAFIKDNPTFLHKENEDTNTNGVFGVNTSDPSEMEVFRSAWASRRSWDHLAEVLAFAPDETYVQDLISQGIVGYSAATSFRDYLRKHSIVSPEDVINDPSSVNWNKISVDDNNLIFRAIVEMVNEDNVLKIINTIEHVADSGNGNLVAAFFQDIVRKAVDPSITGKNASEAKEEIKKILPKITEYLKNTSS